MSTLPVRTCQLLSSVQYFFSVKVIRNDCQLTACLMPNSQQPLARESVNTQLKSFQWSKSLRNLLKHCQRHCQWSNFPMFSRPLSDSDYLGHSILTQCLKAFYVVKDPVFSFLHSYLTNRTHLACFDDLMSTPHVRSSVCNMVGECRNNTKDYIDY